MNNSSHSIYDNDIKSRDKPDEKNIDEKSQEEKLDEILFKSQQPFIKISTVFPFDFFPDEVSVDESKINILRREFFYSASMHSILIESIRDIEIESSMFFATLKIVPDGYPGKTVDVKYLKKHEALKLRKIISGLMIARKSGIDPTKVDHDYLARRVERVGQAATMD